jgi:nicotinate-nucleotide--dimethylbenzimidazole phosphoribosyltransferase
LLVTDSDSEQPPRGAALQAVIEQIDYPDSEAAYQAGILNHELATPGGSLGVLEELSVWAASVQGQCPPKDFARARTILFAGDHGIAEAGVSSLPAGFAATELTRLLAGGGLVNVLADLAGATVRLADLSVDADTDPVIGEFKVRRSSGRIDREDALSTEEAWQAIEAGMRLAAAEIDAGADLLVVGDLGRGNTTVAAAVISVLTDTEPTKVIGRGAGLDDAAWILKCSAIRDARRRAVAHRYDVLRMLATIGGADLAAMTGFLLQSAARRTPVLLDGVFTAAAALLAQSATPRIVRWLRAGQQTAEPAHAIALDRLGLNPITRFGVAGGQAAGALLAVPVVRASVRALTGSANV